MRDLVFVFSHRVQVRREISKWTLFFIICLATLGALPKVAQANAFESFFTAIRENQVDQVTRLLRNGMDANGLDGTGTPALILAVTHKADEVVRLLIAQPGIKIDAVSPNGETAIAVSAWHGNFEQLKLLHSKGAQLNRVGWTPLHYAAAAGHSNIVKFLLENSAYIDAHSLNKTTPLMMAARSRNTDIVTHLLDEGADPSQVNDAGLSAADYLDRSGEPAMAAQVRERARKFKEKYAFKAQPEPKP